MKQKIQTLLKIDDAQYENFSKEDWEKAVDTAKPRFASEDGKKNEAIEDLLTSLAAPSTRVATLDDIEKDSKRYEHLFVATPGTAANKQRQKEKAANTKPSDNMVTSSADGKSLSYNVVGNTPEEIEKNRTLILEAYKKYVAEKYSTLTDAEKEKYQPKEERFATFKDLEKSPTYATLSQEDRDGYKAREGNFPMKITILPFETPEEGKQFIDSMRTKNFIKTPDQLAEENKRIKEEAAKKEPEETPTSTPSLSK